MPSGYGPAIFAAAAYIGGALGASALLNADLLAAHAVGFVLAIVAAAFGWQRSGQPDIRPLLLVGPLALAVISALLFAPGVRSALPLPVFTGAVAIVITVGLPALRGSGSRLAGSVVPAIAAIWLAGIVYTASRDINHDTAWYLASIANWLGGEALYVGVYEVNPPLAFYLYAPSVVFSEATGIDETASLIGWVYLLIAGSLACCYYIASRALDAGPRDWLMLTVAIAMIAAPLADFAQREQLLLILAMPYLLTLALQPAEAGLSWRERALIGLVAVCGLALKPHYLAAPMLMVLVRIVQTRGLAVALRAENLAFGAGCLAYPLFIYLVHPAYIQNVVPFAVDFYGGGYGGATLLDILTVPEMLGAMILVALVRLCPIEDETARRISEVLAGALAGFAMAYLLQKMGWFYHRVPMVAFLGILGAWLAIHLWPLRERLVAASIAALIASGAIVIRPILVADLQFAPPVNAFIRAFPTDMEGRSISAFTFHLGAGFPLATRLDARWASRFPCQWLIPGALAMQQAGEALSDGERAAIDRVLDFSRTATVDDLVRYEPDYVLVDYAGSPGPDGKPFRFLEFLAADPRFNEAWSRYKLQETILGVEIWRRVNNG